MGFAVVGYVFILSCDLTRWCGQRIMWIDGWEPFKVSHHPAKFAKFDDHKHCGSGDMFSVVEEHDCTCSSLNSHYYLSLKPMVWNHMTYINKSFIWYILISLLRKKSSLLFSQILYVVSLFFSDIGRPVTVLRTSGFWVRLHQFFKQ